MKLSTNTLALADYHHNQAMKTYKIIRVK